MLNQLKQRKSDGFTIIEVMIVLAIAGLIMLIVFLAVPALQRNSRNTQTKNDASAVASAINEYSSNNNGALPTAITGTGTVTVGASGTAQAVAKVNGSTVVSTVAAVPAASALDGKVQVYLGHKCDGTASSRATAVYYLVEAGTNSVGCIDN
jgi:prepilin-type N-terminal cleavage/methylation domain-containing protein